MDPRALPHYDQLGSSKDMPGIRFWVLSVLAIMVAAGATAADDPPPGPGKRQRDTRPNIVLIVADDLGYADVGFHGCKDIPTPNLDALARSGVRFTDGYVSGPYCSPTRAGLLTGRYQQRFGHEFNPGPNPNTEAGLPLDQVTLADRLKSAGYATGMVGKWHLGNSEKQHPLSRGFDEFYGFLGGAHSYFPEQGNPQPIFRGRRPIEENEYLTDAFSREAAAYVERHRDEPFFLYYTFNAVHTPMHATEKYLDRFPNITQPKRKSYAAMLSAMDDAVGKLTAALDKHNLRENMLIAFISDNGGPTQANASDNSPLNGVKATVWEGGVRVPFVITWPAKLTAGKTYRNPVIQLDLSPTILAAAGAKIDADSAKFDGVNLLPYLAGDLKESPHRELFWRFGSQWAVRSGDYKLTFARDATSPQLFNLASDIGESQNLADHKPEIVQQLTARWQEWNKDNEEPRWTASNRLAGKKKGKAKGKAN
jgi:arylsulfatase A-like enzyme